MSNLSSPTLLGKGGRKKGNRYFRQKDWWEAFSLRLTLQLMEKRVVNCQHQFPEARNFPVALTTDDKLALVIQLGVRQTASHCVHISTLPDC